MNYIIKIQKQKQKTLMMISLMPLDLHLDSNMIIKRAAMPLAPDAPCPLRSTVHNTRAVAWENAVSLWLPLQWTTPLILPIAASSPFTRWSMAPLGRCTYAHTSSRVHVLKPSVFPLGHLVWHAPLNMVV